MVIVQYASLTLTSLTTASSTINHYNNGNYYNPCETSLVYIQWSDISVAFRHLQCQYRSTGHDDDEWFPACADEISLCLKLLRQNFECLYATCAAAENREMV